MHCCFDSNSIVSQLAERGFSVVSSYGDYDNNDEISPRWDLNPRPKVSAPLPPLRDKRGITKPSHRRFVDVGVDGLVEWLRQQGRREWTVRAIRIYASRFGHILQTENAAELMTLSPRNRHHAMTALANLAKYKGRYDRWLEIRRRYNLKWSQGDSLQVFVCFFNQDLTLDAMLGKVKEMIWVLPPRMAEIVRFACITGLRPAEAVESVKLLNGSQSMTYYNTKTETLQHFHFPDIFLRTTKKAYISYLSRDDYVRIASLGSKSPSWNAIRLACRRRSIGMDMRLCRKIFASHLSACGIQSEVIDMVQGRVSKSVFARNYLTPNNSLRLKVLDSVDKLQREIDSK